MLVALLALFALVAAACGGRDDNGDDTSEPGDDANGSEQVDNGDVVTVSAEDCGPNYNGTQGITEDQILIGNSLPQTGPYSIFDQVKIGIEAYFTHVNDNGGVQGRDLVLVSYDDAYEPARTRQNAQRLVQEDGVFALIGGVGTENNHLVQNFFAEEDLCVPNLMVATGHPDFGDPNNDPWIINGLPNYSLEGVAFADYLIENNPSASVAILAQADSFGDAYVQAFNAAIEGSDIEVVAEQTFDPLQDTSPQGQITTLASSGADALLLALTGLPCPQALQAVESANWDPLTYVTLTCSSKVLMTIAGTAADGTLSTRATYDPGDPSTMDEPAVAAFRTDGAAAGLSEELLNELNVGAGWGFAAWLHQLLEAAPELDRASVMNTAWHQTDVEFGLGLDGVTWTTNGAERPFGFTELQYIIRTDGNWVPEGEVTDFSDRLSELGLIG